MKKYIVAFAMFALMLSACAGPGAVTIEQPVPPNADNNADNPPVAEMPTQAPPLEVLDRAPEQPDVNDTGLLFSNDQLGLCFSYPQGFQHLPENDAVEIVALEETGSEERGLFWLERSDANGRTAEQAADQELADAGGLNAGRWTVILDGEQAVVLDGMPGQDLQRRVLVVHQQTLYVLAFMPTLSENKVASDQVEALYTAITNSWSWSPCSAGG